MVVVQVGGGEVCGRTTGAKALFCLTAETIWTGENDQEEDEDEEEVTATSRRTDRGGE